MAAPLCDIADGLITANILKFFPNDQSDIIGTEMTRTALVRF